MVLFIAKKKKSIWNMKHVDKQFALKFWYKDIFGNRNNCCQFKLPTDVLGMHSYTRLLLRRTSRLYISLDSLVVIERDGYYKTSNVLKLRFY